MDPVVSFFPPLEQQGHTDMDQVAGWNLFVSLGVLLAVRCGKHRGYLSEMPDSFVVHTSSLPLFFFFFALFNGKEKKR